MSEHQELRERERLFEKFRATTDEIAKREGNVTAEQIEELTRLASLVDLYDKAHPSSRKLWLVPLLFGITLLIVSLLLFARINETDVEIVLSVSEVSFVVSEERILAEHGIEISEVGFTGLRQADLPRHNNDAARTIMATGDDNLSLSLMTGPIKEKSKGVLNLAPVVLNAQTGVRIEVPDSPPLECRLTLKGSDPVVRVEANGPLKIGYQNAPAEQLEIDRQAVVLHGGRRPVGLVLTFSSVPNNLFPSEIPVSDLQVSRDKELDVGERTIVQRNASTVLSGTLIFESINNREQKLRPGEAISFEQVQGEVRGVHLHDDHIELVFSGKVRGMSSGTGQHRRSLMPTWLEWLMARHSLSLLWGSALYVFGLVVAILRWFGKSIQ